MTTRDQYRRQDMLFKIAIVATVTGLLLLTVLDFFFPDIKGMWWALFAVAVIVVLNVGALMKLNRLLALREARIEERIEEFAAKARAEARALATGQLAILTAMKDEVIEMTEQSVGPAGPAGPRGPAGRRGRNGGSTG